MSDAQHGRRPGSRDAGAALLAMGLSAVLVLAVIADWGADLSVPLTYGEPNGDANFHHMLVRGVLQNGWYLENQRLGAPFGQTLHDFPQGGDNLHFLAIRALGLLSSDSAAVMNAFFLVGFPLTALSAFLVLRVLRVSRPVAVVCSVLFSLLPYHFARGEEHLFLAAYFAVPLGALLVLRVLAAEPLFARRERDGPRLLAHASRRSLGTLAICLLLGSASGSTYYGVLTAILLLAAAALGVLRSHRRRTVVEAVAATALIGGMLLLNLAPSLLHQIENGRNTVAAARAPGDSEVNGLKLLELVSPADGHRLERFASAKERYTSGTPLLGERGQSLGLVATVGFASLLLAALAALVSTGRPALGALHRDASAATVIAFLVGTAGGGSAVVAYLVTPQLRAWSRMSVFIAFFSLLAVALMLDALGRRLGGSPRRRAAFAAILAMTLVIGVLDQTPPAPAQGLSSAGAAADYRRDAAFVRAVEARLPPGASVFQVPFSEFPDPPQDRPRTRYDALVGYLHSDRLRWSYGDMKGRPPEWQARVARLLPPQLVAEVSRAGFAGLYLDRLAHRDPARATERRLRQVVGAPTLVSPDRRIAFFELRRRTRGSPAP